MTKFGIVGCTVRDHTVSAVTDIPGVLAIVLKGGARLFGDASSLRKTLWHAAQILHAYANPLPARIEVR